MDVDESDLIGKPLEEVPKQDPTDERCMGKKKQKRDGDVVRDDEGRALFGGYCGCWPGKGTDHVGEGRCSRHGGANDGENGQGAPEGNDNAVTSGAFREHFTSHLTDAEQAAFAEAREQLDDPAGAQEIARTAATICLLQFDRSGDERFMRRFESLCDKFGIAPDEVERHEHTGEGGGPIEVTIKRERYDE